VSIREFYSSPKGHKIYEAEVEFVFQNAQLSKLRYLGKIPYGMWSRNIWSKCALCLRRAKSIAVL